MSHNLKDRWEKFRLGDMGKVITGKTPPTKNQEYYGDRYPFITPSDIKTFDVRYLASVERYLSQQGFQYQEKKLLPPKSICYVCIGSTVGKMCMTRVPSFTNQQLNSIICDEAKVTPYFLFYKLQFETPRIQSIADGKGSGKSIVNRTEFENLEIRIPPLEEQHRIASILSAYDDLFENNLRRIKILEEIAQTLYREWFINFRFPGHEKARMVHSPLGKIPEGWAIGTLGELFQIKYGKTLPKKSMVPSGQYPVYGAGDIIGFYDQCVLEEKVALVTCRGAGSGTVRRTREAAFITNNSLMLLPWPQFAHWKYFFAELVAKHSNVKGVLSGSAQPQITITGLSAVETWVPPENVVTAFCGMVEPTCDMIDALYEKNSNLRRTRDLLLPKLISGELDVSDLDIDIGEEAI